MRAIIGLIHADMHQRGTVGSVCHIATSVIIVAPGMKGEEAVAKIAKRSKSGKVMQDVSFSILRTIILCPCAIKRNIKYCFCLFYWGHSLGRDFQYQRGSHSYSAEQGPSTWTQTERP